LNGALLLWAVAVLVGIVVSAEPDLTLPKTTGLLLGLAALHIYGLGDALAPGSKPAVLLWVILGLIAAAGKK
jgi:hypothetical protein